MVLVNSSIRHSPNLVLRNYVHFASKTLTKFTNEVYVQPAYKKEKWYSTVKINLKSSSLLVTLMKIYLDICMHSLYSYADYLFQEQNTI